MSVKKFSDFAEEPAQLDGDKVKMESVLNQKIVVTGYKVRRSKYQDKGNGKCLTIQFKKDGSGPMVIFSGSTVLIDLMEKYGNQVPFATIIKKIDKYYTFT